MRQYRFKRRAKRPRVCRVPECRREISKEACFCDRHEAGLTVNVRTDVRVARAYELRTGFVNTPAYERAMRAAFHCLGLTVAR